MFKITVSLQILLLLLLGGKAWSQDFTPAADSINRHGKWYGQQKGSAVLFLHLDKTVYVNNDVIWFAAYIVSEGSDDLSKHQVLSVSLVNANSQTVIAQDKFVMKGGMALGQLAIPDTVPPGHYSFVATTNRLRNGSPELLFKQSVTLKTADLPAFNVELSLDTVNRDRENVNVLVQVRSKNAPLDGAVINYYLGKDQQTRFAGKAKTGVLGNHVLLIPKKSITAAQHNIEVQVKFNNEVKALHLDIPITQQVTDVKFYPEGGHLVNGLRNRVGWEVKTAGGTAVKTSAVVLAGNAAIDTIETDSFGMGVFGLIPKPGTIYQVRLLGDFNSGQTYPLPPALTQGLALRAANAIVGDTLSLQLQNINSGNVSLVVHNYRQAFLAKIIPTNPQISTVKAILTDVPRGLNVVTIFDSLQRPLAERLFFAHYDQKPTVSIALDKQEKGQREKVHLKLQLKGKDGGHAKAVVSVACVQDNRFEVRNDNNIEHYYYLQTQLENLPLKDDLMGSNVLDRRYMNELLLVRGWSKYKWADMMKATATDTLKQDSLLFSGVVTWFLDRLKKPVGVVLLKDSAASVDVITTDKHGKFILDNQFLYKEPGRKIRTIVNGKSEEYEIKISDPYRLLNNTLAKNIEPVLMEQPLAQNTKDYVLTGFEHATKLREVKITAGGAGFINKNACGDYVCKYHILNCPNHPYSIDNHLPVIGEMVMQAGQGLSRYLGCGVDVARPGMSTFSGIYMAKEFYGADYSIINPIEPDYLSTLCWKSGVLLDTDKATDVSFYTSDITDKFRIVVQGVTNNDVVYSQEAFIVKKKMP